MVRNKLAYLAAGLILAGCSAQDIAKLRAARDQVAAEVTDAKTAEAGLQTQVNALAPDDPVRKSLEPRLAQLDAVITRGQQYIPVVDAAIQSAQSGQIDPNLTAAAGAVPYGSLALAVIGLVWGTVKHIQAAGTLDEHDKTQQAFKQVVTALDAAMPEPTPAQKTAIAGALDADVKSRVAGGAGGIRALRLKAASSEVNMAQAEQRWFGWISPELAVHLTLLIATASAAFCVLKSRADISDLELEALKVRVGAVESEANQTNLLVAQEKVRLDNQDRMLEQTRLTAESTRAVLDDLSGDLKAMKVLLQQRS